MAHQIPWYDYVNIPIIDPCMAGHIYKNNHQGYAGGSGRHVSGVVWTVGIVHFTSEVLVANNSHNYKTNVAPAQPYMMLHRINRHTWIRWPNDGPTMEWWCKGNITKNCKCLPPSSLQSSTYCCRNPPESGRFRSIPGIPRNVLKICNNIYII